MRRAFAGGVCWVASAVAGCTGNAQWQPPPCPSCAPLPVKSSDGPALAPARGAASETEATDFMAGVESDLKRLWVKRDRAAWVAANFITEDTEAMSAESDRDAMAFLARANKDAQRFAELKLAPELARKFHLLKLSGPVPAPNDPALIEELSKVNTALASFHGRARYCPPDRSPLRRAVALNQDLAKELKDKLVCKRREEGLGVNELGAVMAEVRDEEALREAWTAWHATARPMRDPYTRLVALANMGARQIGWKDLGEMWRSGYDMPPEAFAADVERLWQELAPLYQELHCYVRARLKKTYGAVVRDHEPIPAHLLGNMFAQSWANIYPLVEPYKGSGPPDVTAVLKREKWSETRMVRTAEGFFTSLGFDPLPDTFWTRSLFSEPRDREVQCHASAWDVTYSDDLRIKMCIKIDAENLATIHHELGHDYYYHEYRALPILFQQGANDGFHEAIGDTIALSVTPGYFEQIRVVGKGAKDDKATIDYLLKMALEKVAFLPFGRLVDEWRWKVFSGEVAPADANRAFWALRTRYQGVSPPVPRSDDDFDAGAKYHVPGNVPYMRYFLAFVYQFQLHRALCRAAGFTGPLHQCSIYKNKAAGQKLASLLALGASKPWQDALESVSGERAADAGALLEYFAPMRAWLREENKAEQCGW